MQITAEQIVREAKEHQEEDFKPPTQKIADVEELAEYRLQKRKEFEDLIRRVYWNESVWVKYAKWEESRRTSRARARCGSARWITTTALTRCGSSTRETDSNGLSTTRETCGTEPSISSLVSTSSGTSTYTWRR